MEELIRDLAAGDKPDTELAEVHGVAEQTIWDFRMRHKAEIAAVIQGYVSKYDHIWSTKLENHVRVLTHRWEKIIGQMELLEEHARRETETIRNIDPDASEVPYNTREYLAYAKVEAALSHQILEITGQLPLVCAAPSLVPGEDGGEAVNVELYRVNSRRTVDPVEAPAQVFEAESIPEPEPEPVQGMAPVPTAVGPTTTNLADIDGPSWGPS
jgi:hypothetical protein